MLAFNFERKPFVSPSRSLLGCFRERLFLKFADKVRMLV